MLIPRGSGRGVAAVVIAFSLHLPLPAADIYWNGSLNDSWHQNFNWDPFGPAVRRVPTDVDRAVLFSPAGDDVYLGGNTAPINDLFISSGIDLYTNGFKLEVEDSGIASTDISGGARIYVTPALREVGFETDNLLITSNGSLNLEDGDAIVQGNATLFTGGQIFSSNGGKILFGNELRMEDNSILRMFGGAKASFSAGAEVWVRDGSIVDLDHDLSLINGMSFTFESGSRMEIAALNIGNNGQDAGSAGSLVFDSMEAGSTGMDVAENLTIGHASNGSGLLHLKSANTAVLGSTTVEATGSIVLEGNSQFAAYGPVVVDGGTISAMDSGNPIFLDVGTTLTARNEATVSIEGSQHIRANGSFEFYSGADFAVTGVLMVGENPLGTGELVVDGAGSTLDVGNALKIGNDGFAGSASLSNEAEASVVEVVVGESGMGALTVASGAQLNSTISRLAANTGVSGTASVTGTDTSWSQSNLLVVGSSGQGQLTIEAGGRLSSERAVLGSDNSASGMVTVLGNGSSWTVATNLVLGGGSFGDLGGTGILNIQSGGTVNIGDTLVLFTNGTLNLSGGKLTIPTVDFQGGQFQWTSGTLHVENFPNDLVNQNGVLAPGQSAGSTTIIGDYTQQANATLEIEIGGELPVSEYDQVSITGTAILGGELLLAMIDDFLPEFDDTFTVLNAVEGIAGVFSNVTSGQRLETVDGAGSFLVHYGPGSPYDQDQVVLSEFFPAFTADFDNDGDVDGDDLTVWQNAFGAGAGADADGDGNSDGADFLAWQQQFGSTLPNTETVAIPEPAATALLLVSLAIFPQRLFHPRNSCR